MMMSLVMFSYKLISSRKGSLLPYGNARPFSIGSHLMSSAWRISLTPALAFLLLVMASGSTFSQDFNNTYPYSFLLEVANPLDLEREDVMVFVPEEEIMEVAPAFNPQAFVALNRGEDVPAQYNQKSTTHRGLIIMLDKLGPGASKEITVRFKEDGEINRAYTKRTQAEISTKAGGRFEDGKYIGGEFKNRDSLRVPDEHTDHSYYIRYEGPGWESDKVGYRYYLDWRNATDVFGKQIPDMVLHQVGQDGFDSYHEMQPWGMDILKVGESLGVGSLGIFNDGKARRIDETDSVIAVIAENGDVFSAVTTHYYGWKIADPIDITSNLSIHAGSRLTRHDISIEGNPANLCTGIGKDDGAKRYTHSGGEAEWGYIATYGDQSLNNDAVGLAVFFNPDHYISFTEDEHSHIVTLAPLGGKIEYYFLAAWELEPDGIRNEQEFLHYIRQTSKELAHPVRTRITLEENKQ